MKTFLAAFSLITISVFAVFAQDSANESGKDKDIISNNDKINIDGFSSIEKKPKFDRVEIDIIKDEKIKPEKLVINKFAPKNDNNFATRQSSGDDYNKNEFFVGYSYQNLDRGNRQHFNGFNVSYVRNVTRYIGIKGDMSGAYKNSSFSFTSNVGTNTFTLSGDTKDQLYNFLGGVQFKDNASEKKLKPFANLLLGVAHNRFTTDSTCTGDCTGIVTGRASFSNTNFAGAFGGGLDIKINDKIDFRAVQFDYNPIFPGGGVVNNFRVGVGIVIK